MFRLFVIIFFATSFTFSQSNRLKAKNVTSSLPTSNTLSDLNTKSLKKSGSKKKKRKHRKYYRRGKYYSYSQKKSKSYIYNLITIDSVLDYTKHKNMDYVEFINLLYSTYNCKALDYWQSYFTHKHLNFVQNYYKTKCAIVGRIIETDYYKIKLIDSILMSHNVPVQMKYLAVIESYLNEKALSRVGAVGAWQFMKPTGRFMGLKINKRVDKRTDLVKSTIAAAKYMKYLYDQFHDWLLVVAAYNCGPGRVRRAIKKSGTTDVWKLELSLPRETRGHVKKFVATLILMEIMIKNGDENVLQSPFFASISKKDLILKGIMSLPTQVDITIQKPIFKYEYSITKQLSTILQQEQKKEPETDRQVGTFNRKVRRKNKVLN